MKKLVVVCASVGFSACAATSTGYSEAAVDNCKLPQENFIDLVGTYSGAITTDEGWGGFGNSSITIDMEKNCAVTEMARMTLQPSGKPDMISSSKTVIAWDELEKVWKLISMDDRGYTHIARGGLQDDGNWSFLVDKINDSSPTRRIVYRNLDAKGFSWVWQGRESANTNWKDRLVKDFKRLN